MQVSEKCLVYQDPTIYGEFNLDISPVQSIYTERTSISVTSGTFSSRLCQFPVLTYRVWTLVFCRPTCTTFSPSGRRSFTDIEVF